MLAESLWGGDLRGWLFQSVSGRPPSVRRKADAGAALQLALLPPPRDRRGDQRQHRWSCYWMLLRRMLLEVRLT